MSEDVKTKIRKIIKPGDQQTFWRAVNLAINRGDNAQINELNYNGSIAVTNSDKAQMFANYFREKVEKLKQKTELQNCYNGTLKPKTPNKNFFTHELVYKILRETKKSQCAGFDRVPMVYYRDGAEVLSKPITELFNKIYNSNVIPEQWKIGKITPIPKKGRSKDISNYRPITSLCSLAKIFERCILTRIVGLNDVTGTNQHGFKANHSTNTALLQLQQSITESIDAGKYHGLVSLDLSAAFDMVNHNLLIERMSIAGIPDDVIMLIKNWLTNRTAYIEIGGESSMFFEVPDGTVQGSVLGPILFTIFISPMFEIINATSFADDSYIGDNDYNLEVLVQKLQNQTTVLTNWFKASGLVVNEDKTEFCLFHKTQKPKSQFTLNGTVIKSKNTMKALGITLDSNLNWEVQISNIYKSTSKVNMGFRLMKKYFNEDELLKLATSFYYSKMYYAASVWLIPTLTTKLQSYKGL